MAALGSFWMRFAGDETPIGFRMGCGVAAYTRDDAFALLLEVWPAKSDDPVIIDVAEDIELTTLDRKYVLPNIGEVTRRGVWLPNFAHVSEPPRSADTR